MTAYDELIEETMRAEQDFFTLTDRKELIRHGLQLERIGVDIQDLKILFDETLRRGEETRAREAETLRGQDAKNETRLRALEDAKLTLQTQLRTAWWIAGIIGAAVGTIVQFAFKILWK